MVWKSVYRAAEKSTGRKKYRRDKKYRKANTENSTGDRSRPKQKIIVEAIFLEKNENIAAQTRAAQTQERPNGNPSPGGLAGWPRGVPKGQDPLGGPKGQGAPRP